MSFTEAWFPPQSQDAIAALVRIVRHVPGAIIEIGAWQGCSTVALANAAHPRPIHTIDTWQGSGHEISEQLAAERDVYAEWRTNVDTLTAGNVIEHRGDWRDMLPTITDPVALAFIDAEHSYIEVRDNIAALLPQMVPGGIICGDDAHHGPVQDAVTEMLGDDVYVNATLWIWQKPIPGATVVPPADMWTEALRAIEPSWRDYVSTRSALDHAVSMSTAAYLAYLVEKLRPCRVLDLGSGFSSLVLRGGPGEVTSVETDPAWCEVTRDYLAEHGHTDPTLLLNPDHIDGEYDLIFVDIANGETREDWARRAVGLLAPNGVIVFDDAQVHGDAYREAARAAGLVLAELPETRDAIERWAMVAVKIGDDLARKYAEACATPSDIYLHLPRMVELVTSLNAKHVIELGTRGGVSTFAWLYALQLTGGRLTSVDIDPRPDIGEWEHWSFIQGDDCSAEVIDQLEQADIVLIDTSHEYGHTVRELDTYSKLVRPGGVICLHDTQLPIPDGAPPRPLFPVRKAMMEFVKRTGWDFHNFPDCWGFGVIRVP